MQWSNPDCSLTRIDSDCFDEHIQTFSYTSSNLMSFFSLFVQEAQQVNWEVGSGLFIYFLVWVSWPAMLPDPKTRKPPGFCKKQPRFAMSFIAPAINAIFLWRSILYLELHKKVSFVKAFQGQTDKLLKNLHLALLHERFCLFFSVSTCALLHE